MRNILSTFAIMLFISSAAYAASTPSVVNVTAAGEAQDWQKDLQHIIDEAEQHGQNVHLGAGTFLHSGILTVQGIEVSGEGAATIVEGTTADNSAIILTGSGSRLSNLKLTFESTERSMTDESSLVLAKHASNFTISHLIMDGSNSTGVFVLGSDNGIIEYNDISNTLADSIHITAGSSHITVHDNATHHSGDYGIAVVSYEKNDTRVAHVNIYNNSIMYNKYARGITVVGGEDVDIHGNTVACDKGYAGIYIASEPYYHTYGASNVRVRNNILHGCGGIKIWQGAIMVYTGYRDNDHISVSDNQIENSPFAGIIVLGKGNHSVSLTGNTLVNSGGEPIIQRELEEPAEVSGNSIQ